jgi:hypothetical protein
MLKEPWAASARNKPPVPMVRLKPEALHDVLSGSRGDDRDSHDDDRPCR